MSKPKKDGKKDGKKEEVKQQPPFVKEIVKLTDNLPKVPIKHRIEEIRRIMQTNTEMIEKYVPPEKKSKYEKNFKLFDRNNDNLLIYEEAKEFLISIGQMISEEDLKEFYKEMVMKTEINDAGNVYATQGIEFENILQIVIEKMREEDPFQQLTQAFSIILEGRNQTSIPSDDFKQFLMTMGYKWPEDLSDEFIKQFQPKADKKITPADVIKKLIKR